MNLKKSVVRTALIAAMGIGMTEALLPQSAAAVGLSDGSYIMFINTTPIHTTTSGFTSIIPGKDGAWNSSFAFGGPAPSGTSWAMTDNGVTVLGSDNISRGSAIGGDGYAGRIGISVVNNNFNVTSFSVDTILNTAAGDAAEYGPASGMTGNIDPFTGQMIFTPTGRLGALSAPNTFYDRMLNVDDQTCTTTGCTSNGNTLWSAFTTGSTSNGTNTITGAPLVSLGDINGDGVLDYRAILVLGSKLGSNWDGFVGAPYFEVWNVNIVSAVPVPAAFWLFSSGLIGILGFIRLRSQL